MSEKMYTVANISRITGYNRSTITRWLDKENIKYARMQGNAPLYDAQVLNKFKETHDSKEVKPNKKDEIIAEKNARIRELSDEVELLKKQLAVKDEQIKVANQLANQAQQLNLADKPQLTHNINVEKSNERASSVEEANNQSKDNAEKPRPNWFQRHFGKK